MYIEVIFGMIFGIYFTHFFLNIWQRSLSHGPNSNKVMNTVYYDVKYNKYYKFTPELCIKPLLY
jgi:hypothetical protein